MKEVLNYYKKHIQKSNILKKLNLKKENYFLISLHREENVDDKIKLKKYFNSIIFLTKKFKKKAIISTHFRTKKKLRNLNIKNKNLVFKKPFGFLDYMALQMNSLVTLSDSGTLSEESSITGRASVHLRHCTERPEGLENGAIILSEGSEHHLLRIVKYIIKRKKFKNYVGYSFNNVSKIIVKKMISFLNKKKIKHN